MRPQGMKPETQTWTPGKIKHEIPEPETGQTDNTTTNKGKLTQHTHWG